MSSPESPLSEFTHNPETGGEGRGLSGSENHQIPLSSYPYSESRLPSRELKPDDNLGPVPASQIGIEVGTDPKSSLESSTQQENPNPHNPEDPEEHATNIPQGSTGKARAEQHRRARAQELGLLENASWDEIFAFLDRQDRITVARALEFEEDYIEYVTWRNILTEVLGLDGTASSEKIIERIKEIRDKERGNTPFT